MEKFQVGEDSLEDLQQKTDEARHVSLGDWEWEGGAIAPGVGSRSLREVSTGKPQTNAALHYVEFLETFSPKTVDRMLGEIRHLRALINQVNTGLTEENLLELGCNVETAASVRNVVDQAIAKYNEDSP